MAEPAPTVVGTEPPAGFPGRVGEGTVLTAGFGVDVRLGPQSDRVIIGRDCALECRITLEREVGTITIGEGTFIGRSNIVCAEQIAIGSGVLIAWGCTIVDHDSHSIRWEQRAQDIARWREGLISGDAAAADLKDWSVVPSAPVRIGDRAWLGFNVIVLKGVTIGEGAVIGAGSVVTKDVPAWTVAAGNPARVIKDVSPGEQP